MWRLEFTYEGPDVFFGKIATKFNVVLTGYPVSFYERKNVVYHTIVGTIKGENKDKGKK